METLECRLFVGLFMCHAAHDGRLAKILHTGPDPHVTPGCGEAAVGRNDQRSFAAFTIRQMNDPAVSIRTQAVYRDLGQELQVVLRLDFFVKGLAYPVIWNQVT